MPQVRRHRVSKGFTYEEWRSPEELKQLRHAALREQLVAASSEAFGTEMSTVWQQRLAGDFFDSLDRFYLILPPEDGVVGWTSARAATISKERCVYFDSTGIVPEHQGSGLIRAVQRSAVLRELSRRPLRP